MAIQSEAIFFSAQNTDFDEIIKIPLCDTCIFRAAVTVFNTVLDFLYNPELTTQVARLSFVDRIVLNNLT